MKPISVYRPSSIEEAIQILSLHGTQAGVYAGGTDLLIQLKNRIEAAPTFLVDIKKIDGLRYIKEDGQGGVQIGALTKLAEVAESNLLAKKYPMLVEAVQKTPRPNSGMPLPSVETCCSRCGVSICGAVTPATAMGDIFATERSETTAITTRPWEAGCAMRCTQEISRRR